MFLKKLPVTPEIDILPYNKFGEDKIERYNLPRERLRLPIQNDATLESIKSKFHSVGLQVHVGG